MNELIEKLKDKNYVRAFGLMTPGEQKLLRKANTSNCLFYNPGGNWLTIRCDMDFDRDRTYAIKPDYQPEPEYVDLEIELEECKDEHGELRRFLGVWNTPKSFFLPYQFTHLHCLPSLPNFDGIWFRGENSQEVWIAFQETSSRVYEGMTVYARFRS